MNDAARFFHPDLIADVDRFMRMHPRTDRDDLMDLLAIAAGSEAGWGVWIVNENRWCNAADGDGKGLLVFRNEQDAKAGADHQSVMYDLGPCEARPFDLVMEVQ